MYNLVNPFEMMYGMQQNQMNQQQMYQQQQGYPMQRNQMYQNQMQGQMQDNNFDFILVNSLEEIDHYQIGKIQRVWFMHQSEPIIAVKISDNLGKTDTRYFNIFEFDPKKQKAEQETQELNKFVTPEMFDNFRESVETKINKKFEEMENSFLELIGSKEK